MAKKANIPQKATRLEYDAAKSTGRRRAPSNKLYAEHVILPDSKRKKLLGTVQDQVRNASVAAWMIRRHLDYVSKFKFQFRTENEPLNRLVNRLFDWHARPKHFDIAERLGREEMFRMFEFEKITAGDAAMVKLGNMKLQAVESDMIAMPKAGKYNPATGSYEPMPSDLAAKINKDTGVIMDMDAPGRVAQYCICNRGPAANSVVFDHLEDAENVIFDAYWTRFSSQIRGVSPLSTAINSIQDIYEGVDFNLAKAKVHALFGIALMRDYAGAADDQEEVSAWGSASGVTTGTTEGLTGASETEAGTKSVSATVQEIKPGEMMMVDMDTKGRIDTIESKTPSAEFQAFTELAIRLALLALDIPFTAFNSRSASFSGMIADQNIYEVSCKWKREKNLWKRYEYSDWLLKMAWDSEDWNLRAAASSAGITRLRELQDLIEWMPTGSPWLMKLQEVQGDIKAISVGLDNPIDACKRRGTDFFQNIDKISAANEYARKNNVPIMIGEPGQATVVDIEEKIEPNTSKESGDD